MAGKELDRRCVTCKDLSNCNSANEKILSHMGGCLDWTQNDELARDAREEIEIEFGPLALLCLTPKRQQAPSLRKGRHHARRR